MLAIIKYKLFIGIHWEKVACDEHSMGELYSVNGFNLHHETKNQATRASMNRSSLPASYVRSEISSKVQF